MMNWRSENSCQYKCHSAGEAANTHSTNMGKILAGEKGCQYEKTPWESKLAGRRNSRR